MEKRSLYNLPHLQEKPHATVLVVEGEKTADQALSKFPKENFVCVTWPSGAKAASLADWTPLTGRRILIWPDNDKAGRQAAEDVCHELRKVGVESLKVIDPVALERHFPEKWDLADPIPSTLNKEFLQELVSSASHKGIDPEQVLYRFSSYRSELFGRAKVNEVLFRVDERLRPQLEVKFGKQYWKIQDEVLKETCKILQTHNSYLQKGGGEFTDRLAYQAMLLEAKHGKIAQPWEIDRIKQIMRDFNESSLAQYGDKSLIAFSLDKTLAQVHENSFRNDLSKIDIHKEVVPQIQLLTKQLERQHTLEVSQKQTSLNKGLDLSH